MKRAVFLDRDGVINKVLVRHGRPSTPQRFEEFEWIEGIGEEVRRIKEAGFYVFVITNQPDVARGILPLEELDKMSAAIRSHLPVDEVWVCPHDDDARCDCRKPKPGMVQRAREFSGWAENINVKIPIHGPNGELHYLELAHHLEKNLNIRVNVTAMMNAQQCFLAALSGATYVSLFGGRVNNMGYNCVEEIRKLRTLLDRFELKSKIIVGSTREVLNVIEWLAAGAHIVTATPNLLEGMLVHPCSKETVQMFLKDVQA